MVRIVDSWNDFGPLKRVILGCMDSLAIPPEEPVASEKAPIDSEMCGMWGSRPTETVEKASAQLDYLVKVFQDSGVVADRPTLLQWNQAIVTPDFRIDSGSMQMPPCDILLTVGNKIMASVDSFRCWHFEYLAYWDLMGQCFEEDPEFKWTQAPRPRSTDKSYRHNYYGERITIEERLGRMVVRDSATTEVESMRDAADAMRLGRDLFIQHGLITSRKAMEWFKRCYPDLQVHVVDFPGNPYPTHIDMTFVPLRPGPIINNPQRRLPEEQRKILEANDWQIVDAVQSAHETPPPLCYSSAWLSMNRLALNHKTVICEASGVHQMEQMDKLGMNVISVPFRDAYLFGDDSHCAIANVYREGGKEDYFSNQVEDSMLV